MSTNLNGNPQGVPPTDQSPPGGNPPPQGPAWGTPPPQYQTPPPPAPPSQQPPYQTSPPQQPPSWQPPTWQTPPRPPHHERHGGDFVFPLILIALGVIFLLGQANIITVNWGLIWPVLLIVIGIGLIFNRRSAPGWLIAVLIVLIVVFIGFLIIPNVVPGLSVSLGETRTLTDQVSMGSLGSARQVALNINEPAGTAILHPDTSPDNQAVRIITTSNIQVLDPVITNLSGDTYRVDVSYRRNGNNWLPFLSPFNWGAIQLDRDIGINPILPLQLDVQMNSGRVSANTTNISLNQASFTFTSGELIWDAGTKVSSSNPDILFHFTSGQAEAHNLGYTNFRQLNVEFTSGNGIFNLAGLTPGVHSLRVGITSGDIRIQIPRGTAYSVSVDRTSGSAVVDGQSLVNGQQLQSPNYASATTKLDIRLGLTSGSINVDLVSF